MTFRAEALQQIAEEIARGEAARGEGFEGRARVCARRAAGIAVREYLALRGAAYPGLASASAYDLLAYLRDLPETPPVLRARADRLLAQVNKDFALPVDADLLDEARSLARELDSQLREKKP